MCLPGRSLYRLWATCHRTPYRPTSSSPATRTFRLTVTPRLLTASVQNIHCICISPLGLYGKAEYRFGGSCYQKGARCGADPPSSRETRLEKTLRHSCIFDTAGMLSRVVSKGALQWKEGPCQPTPTLQDWSAGKAYNASRIMQASVTKLVLSFSLVELTRPDRCIFAYTLQKGGTSEATNPGPHCSGCRTGTSSVYV
jgi:hypothetical protein